jgi:hypothetical protein
MIYLLTIVVAPRAVAGTVIKAEEAIFSTRDTPGAPDSLPGRTRVKGADLTAPFALYGGLTAGIFLVRINHPSCQAFLALRGLPTTP